MHCCTCIPIRLFPFVCDRELSLWQDSSFTTCADFASAKQDERKRCVCPQYSNIFFCVDKHAPMFELNHMTPTWLHRYDCSRSMNIEKKFSFQNVLCRSNKQSASTACVLIAFKFQKLLGPAIKDRLYSPFCVEFNEKCCRRAWRTFTSLETADCAKKPLLPSPHTALHKISTPVRKSGNTQSLFPRCFRS